MIDRLGEVLVPDPIRRRYTLKFGIALLVLAASIVVIGVMATDGVRTAIAEDVDDQYTDQAVREARSVEAWHRSNERTVRSMSAADDLRSGDRAAIDAYLVRQRARQSGTVEAIHYVDYEAGRVVASTSDHLDGASLSSVDEPWTELDSASDAGVDSTAAYRSDAGEAVLAYVAPVDRTDPDADGRALVVTIRAATYSDRLSRSGEVHTTVVDDRGRILFSPRGSMLGEYGDGAEALSTARASDDGTGAVTTTPPESVRSAMFLEEGQEVVVGYDRVEDTGWVVLVHVSTDSAYGTVDDITSMGLGATGVVAALIVGVGIALGRNTARSIDRLTAKAEQVKRGNYDVDLSTPRVDNVGRLYEAFGDMATALGDRERTLRSQQAMLESERDRLVALFKNGTDSVARLSREPGGLVVRDANALFDRTFASDLEVPVSDDFEAIIDQPDDEQRLSAIIDEAGSEGTEREITARTSEGTRTFQFRWIPIGDGDGDEGYAVFTDITDRKERERELKRYESVIEALGDPVYALDTEGRLTFVNEANVETFGYAESELLGTSVGEKMRDEDVDRVEALIEDLHESDDRNSVTIEYEMRAADGSWIPVENHLTVLEDDGELLGSAGVLRDISERKEREKQLERSEQRYRALVENSPAPIGIITPDRTMAYCNRAGLEFLGADSMDEIRGRDALSVMHSDDQESAKQRIGTVIEDRTVVDPLEERFVCLDGTERVAMVTSTPVTYEDQPAAMVVLNDVTERKQYERALRSLNDAARRLLNTETEGEIAEVVADAAETAIDADGCAVYLLESGDNRLDPAGFTPGFVEATGGTPTVEVGDETSAVWEAYVNERRVVVDPDRDDAGPSPPGTATAGQFYPLGDHGVFAVVSPGSLDEETERLVELLAATTEAAFDRLDSEASLRERESLLEQQNERLERQVQINRAIRDVQKTLTGASTREEIERGACRGLSDLDQFRFAWIGEYDTAEDRMVPRVWAGEGQGYLDEVTVGDAHEDEPAWHTATTGEATVIPNVVDEVHNWPWRKDAISYDFNSVISVPLSYQDYTYGVLSVYAEEPQTFGSLERAVFEELGITIADAINAVATKQALYDDRALELKFQVEAAESSLGTIARETGGRVEFDGMAGGGGDGTRVFFSVTGVDPDEVSSVLDDAVSVADSRVVRESEDGGVFEATVEGSSFVSTLVDYGGRLRSCVADGTDVEYVVDLPPETDVREFVGMLEDRYPSAELVARRDVERSVGSKEELVDSVLGELTDRQREVLATAYFGGFFEWPRESTGEDVADMLGVSQPTVNRHLRLAQRAILSELLKEGAPEVTSAGD